MHVASDATITRQSVLLAQEFSKFVQLSNRDATKFPLRRWNFDGMNGGKIGLEFLDLLSMIVKVAGTDLTLKRNQAYVMKYIMQNYKKVAFVLDLPKDERWVLFSTGVHL